MTSAAGLPVDPGILAGRIHIKTMMRVLDHRHTQAVVVQMRNEQRQQRCLARSAPACQTNDLHRVLARPSYRPHPEPLYNRLLRNVMLTSCAWMICWPISLQESVQRVHGDG